MRCILMMMFKKQRGIYLDSGSFTPLEKKAHKAICSVLQEQVESAVGNPLSMHTVGRRARKYITDAAECIARAEEMKSENVIFTSGATEAIQIALRTAICTQLRKGRRLDTMHILAGPDEHSAVYRFLDHFAALGVRYTRLNADEPVTPENVLRNITDDTIALTLQYVNNSNGRIFPLAKVAAAIRKQYPDIFLHSDAAQASSYYRCAPEYLGFDAVGIDSAKSFGPQGMGALLFRNISQYGGLSGERTEMDMRPGTASSALIYGFGIAFREVRKTRKVSLAVLAERKQYLLALLAEHLPQTVICGLEKRVGDVTEKDLQNFSPHILKLSFPNTNHLYLATLLERENVFVSTTSACSVGNDKEMRIGMLPTTTERELQVFISAVVSNLSLASNQ